MGLFFIVKYLLQMNQETDTKIKSKIHEDLSPTRNLTGFHLKIVAAIAIILSLIHI